MIIISDMVQSNKIVRKKGFSHRTFRRTLVSTKLHVGRKDFVDGEASHHGPEVGERIEETIRVRKVSRGDMSPTNDRNWVARIYAAVWHRFIDERGKEESTTMSSGSCGLARRKGSRGNFVHP